MVSLMSLKLAVMAIMIATSSAQLPTVYEYFADSQNLTGLVAENKEFRLNNKPLRIISGAIHYFRVHPDLWRDRLRKLRAIGANTVETYVAWNLHEPRRGEFDFGNGTNDFSAFLNIRRYIQLAQEEDLLVIFRPGPYICSEWDFGGLPSWLQRDPNMRVRENYQPYLDRTRAFLNALLPHVVDLQFSRGGPIIAAQIENEYGAFEPRSPEYLELIRQTFLDNGLDCLHFTSDNSFPGNGTGGTLPGILQTANFQTGPETILNRLAEVQPDKPLMVMEYWTGWYSHWFDSTRGTTNPEVFRDVLQTIFSPQFNGSVNFYMFHGGTNFGFMAGGNVNSNDSRQMDYDITSYDYDAMLSEAGDYTVKYEYAAVLINQYEMPRLRRPLRPVESNKVAYPTLNLQRYLTYADIIERVPYTHKVELEKPMSMELIPVNNDNGQSYGYVIYRKIAWFNAGDRYKVSWATDLAELIIDGAVVDTGFSNSEPDYWLNNVRELSLNVTNGQHVVDLLVENMARINYGVAVNFIQQKGIAEVYGSKIEINDQEIQGVQAIALEFKNEWVKSLQNWRNVTAAALNAPCLIQSTFTISDEPSDTFIDMSAWHKGIVFVNGFNIGRYFRAGPQQTLYVPAPLLTRGENTITVFEQLEPSTQIVFTNVPNLGRPGNLTHSHTVAEEH